MKRFHYKKVFFSKWIKKNTYEMSGRKHGGAKRMHKGAGLGEFLAGTLGGLGTGLGTGTSNLFKGLFGGARRRPRKQGGSLISDLNELAKETKIISKGLNKFGINPLGIAGVADSLGYGRKKRARRGGAIAPVKF